MSGNSFTFNIIYRGLKVPCKCTPLKEGELIQFEFYSSLVSSTRYRSHFIFKEEFLCLYPNVKEGYISCATDFLPGLIEQRFLEEPSIFENILELSLSYN